MRLVQLFVHMIEEYNPTLQCVSSRRAPCLIQSTPISLDSNHSSDTNFIPNLIPDIIKNKPPTAQMKGAAADPGLYNAEIYSCKSCGPFPLFNLKDITAQVLKAVEKYPLVIPTADPKDFNFQRDVIRPPIAHALSAFKPELRSAAMIKETIPLFSPSLGGIAFGPNGRADIPLYVCGECRALFVLPSEVRDAGVKTDPMNGPSLPEDYVRGIAVSAMESE